MKKSEMQGKLWGKSPNGWAEVQEHQHKPLWEDMFNATGVKKDTILLDVGCGSGGASAFANERGAIVHGIDVAEGLISLAIQRVPNAKFKLADIEKLPYEDNMFDVVFAANSIQYTEDRIAALHELKRVCKPGGHLVAGLFGPPEKVNFSAIFKALGDAMPGPPKGGGPFELSMPGKLEGLFMDAGLVNVKTGEVNSPFEYSNFDTFWYANSSAGPMQGMLQVLTESKLKAVLKDAAKNFFRDDGSILFQTNIFKYVTAII